MGDGSWVVRGGHPLQSCARAHGGNRFQDSGTQGAGHVRSGKTLLAKRIEDETLNMIGQVVTMKVHENP